MSHYFLCALRHAWTSFSSSLVVDMNMLRWKSSNVVAGVRRYATRRPERPPMKVKDPLLSSPNADIQQLPEGLTFIHRPPPTKESVFSTTALPASPLLHPKSSSKPSSSSSPAENSTENTISVSVPPRMQTPRAFSSNRLLSESDFAEMRRLRSENPQVYTRGKLAKLFNCPPFLVAQQVPLTAADKRAALRKREMEHADIREQWGERKSMSVAARKRRKEFW